MLHRSLVPIDVQYIASDMLGELNQRRQVKHDVEHDVEQRQRLDQKALSTKVPDRPSRRGHAEGWAEKSKERTASSQPGDERRPGPVPMGKKILNIELHESW